MSPGPDGGGDCIRTRSFILFLYDSRNAILYNKSQLMEPSVVDESALSAFRQLVRNCGLNPDDQWVGGYVEYEWTHVRHVFQAYELELPHMHVLEFGCNYGASAIVLALLGARVTAIDVSEEIIQVAKANAAIYGVADRISFLHVPDTTCLPFEAAAFDMINCNSVLEYIPWTVRGAVQNELDRVLRSQGLVFVSGTSNGLWPREMHSRKWLVNYLPRFVDRFLTKGKPIERGVSPWEIRRRFARYENVDWTGKGRQYLEAKRRMGMTSAKLGTLKILNLMSRFGGVWLGMLTPSLTLTLRKP